MRAHASRSALVAATALAVASPVIGTLYTDRTAWRAAAPGWMLESFDTIAPGTQVSSLPSLGLTLDVLKDGTHYPSVQTTDGFGGVSVSSPNVLFNAIVPALGGLGLFVIRPAAAGATITALGCFNTGGDDGVVVEFCDAGGAVIEASGAVTVASFVGIVNASGAASVRIVPSGGNGFFSADDLHVVAGGQEAVEPIPMESRAGLLVLVAMLAALGAYLVRRH